MLRLARALFFTQKQVFGPCTAKSQPIRIKFCITYYCTDFVGRLRPRSARGRLQAKPKRLFCSTCNALLSPIIIETTDRRDFGCKPSEWRWGWMLSWKIREFCSVGGARSKNSIFSHFQGTLRLSCAQPTGNSFTSNQQYWWKNETLNECFEWVSRV